MAENPLRKLETYGQSIWLDFIRRGMLVSGELQRLIDEDGVSGVTSNPSIFEKAIVESHDYDEAIGKLIQTGKSAPQIYQELAIEDIRMAADLFRPLYDRSNARDGYVSLEVSPHLAQDTPGTVAEAHRLWQAVDRPNIFIKVPATMAGVPAIHRLTADGINVNVTLLFSIPRYLEVADAYLSGLEDRAMREEPVRHIVSVASFFLSRIDVLVDPMLERLMEGEEYSLAEPAGMIHGEVAIASAKIAYQHFKQMQASERGERLKAQGAYPQRLLWASTSTKNPAYSDVKYVEALIGQETVNTLPLETINAYRDHGDPAPRLEEGVEEAGEVLTTLDTLGINLDEIAARLEEEGQEKFDQPYDRLLQTIEKKLIAQEAPPLDRQSFNLGAFTANVEKRLDALAGEQFSDRLWRKDPTLWKSDPAARQSICNSLGWLHVAEKIEWSLPTLADFVAEVKAAGFRHVVHMGMGGSSLAPLVFQRTFPVGQDALPLTVLDTTDPETIRRLADELPLMQTLFIVASKSGTTLEPITFFHYFYDRLKAMKGEKAGGNFVAITDPGTPLMQLAKECGFRRTFLNFADIGGRYSALSYFGLLPAALMGVDLDGLLQRALRMEYACTPSVPLRNNPGMRLGAALGELATHGVNKVTFITPEPITSLGLWLEQLLAESTGKDGTGLLPVAGEPTDDLSMYGDDRVFVYFRLQDAVDQRQEKMAQALCAAGHPLVTIRLEDPLQIGEEFFRWELATATAGSILGINAFDQPNVQESKDNTNRLLDQYDEVGHLPEEQPSLTEKPLSLYDGKSVRSLTDNLRAFFGQERPGDYIALLAYLTESDENDQALELIRLRLRDATGLATTVGYGPRYLHSTGQFHRGGPNTGLFFLLTAPASTDVPIPDEPYSFNILRQAQALGDFQALQQHGRRSVRIDLGSDVRVGLLALKEVIDDAVSPGRHGMAA